MNQRLLAISVSEKFHAIEYEEKLEYVASILTEMYSEKLVGCPDSPYEVALQDFVFYDETGFEVLVKVDLNDYDYYASCWRPESFDEIVRQVIGSEVHGVWCDSVEEFTRRLLTESAQTVYEFMIRVPNILGRKEAESVTTDKSDGTAKQEVPV